MNVMNSHWLTCALPRARPRLCVVRKRALVEARGAVTKRSTRQAQQQHETVRHLAQSRANVKERD
jgi:hypothetical protein